MSLEKYGLPGLIIVLSASSVALIIKLIQRNGCLLHIRSCCSTKDPCCLLDCNKGRAGDKKSTVVIVDAEDEV